MNLPQPLGHPTQLNAEDSINQQILSERIQTLIHLCLGSPESAGAYGYLKSNLYSLLAALLPYMLLKNSIAERPLITWVAISWLAYALRDEGLRWF